MEVYMEQLRCDECGRTINANAHRCSYCGCPIEIVVNTTISTTPCPKCGKSIDREMKYCPHCGEKQTISNKATPLPATNNIKQNKPTPNIKLAFSDKQENKASTDTLEVPMPPKPKIGKGIVIYTVILFALILWLVSIGGLVPAVLILFFPIIVYAIAYIALNNDYKLAQTDYPKYVM